MNSFNPAIEIVTTEEDLQSVLAIYRSQKSLLGLLPDGAFRERVHRRQIYVAKADGIIVGYLLFSTNQRMEVRIAHLVVAKEYRGKGISNSLLNQLKSDFCDYTRIRLHCRADYDAAKIWPRLGFVACRRKVGKSGCHELIVFQYRLKDMPLFDELDEDAALPVVVCDANVFMDMRYPERERHESAMGLQADWLVGELEFKYTEEILNDFSRLPSPSSNQMSLFVRSNWEQVAASQNEIELNRKIVRKILGGPKNDSAASDQSHLAIAAASGAIAFATYDEELLRKSSELFNETGLRVQRPSEIIVEIDSILRCHHYQYKELRNTGIERHRVKRVSEVQIEKFLREREEENHRQFQSYLDSVLSLPKDYDLHQICDDKKQSLALFSVRKLGGTLRILEKIRVANKIGRTILGRTLIDYIGHQPLGAWNSGESRVVKIDDRHISPDIAAACLNRGFLLADESLWRISLPGFWNRRCLIEELDKLADSSLLPRDLIKQFVKMAEVCESPGNEEIASHLEHLIHPGKLRFGNLPTYVVPIKPEWAQELFDFRIWSRPLFAPETSLVINPDSVYYKKPKNSPATDFGRILWYVSENEKKGGNSIRACSALTRRVNGTVKNLFKEYQRMGVFEWPQLMNHFGSSEAEALAIEFTDTELLPSPIRLNQVNDILEKNSMKRQQFVSSVKIPFAAFEEIYKKSTLRVI
jgi:ribosomal protein S18 acetylase RimI-like enzyme/predicted nucleic acid-binding protein